MIELTRHFVVYDKNTGRIIRTGSVPILPDGDGHLHGARPGFQS